MAEHEWVTGVIFHLTFWVTPFALVFQIPFEQAFEPTPPEVRPLGGPFFSTSWQGMTGGFWKTRGEIRPTMKNKGPQFWMINISYQKKHEKTHVSLIFRACYPYFYWEVQDT